MTRQQFERLLETYGADMARWPETLRPAARALMARDDSVRAAHAAAARLDGLLDQFAPRPPIDAAERVIAALHALPPQQPVDAGAPTGWGAALAELWWELRAVPRIPSIVVAVLCGLVVGFASLNLSHLDAARVDLSALLFEPTPSDWLQL
jgi:hypothetical protein